MIVGWILLPIPSFFDPDSVEQPFRAIDLNKTATQAADWARRHSIKPAREDKFKIGMLLVDLQVDFCIPPPAGKLYVGGRSGRGAVEDNVRLCRFIYANLNRIGKILVTLDTHFNYQIFFDLFWVDEHGRHPDPMTEISLDAVRQGVWRPNPEIAMIVGQNADWLSSYAGHYVAELERKGRYKLFIWPYHTMFGDAGHALVPSVFECLFFHSVARKSSIGFESKGGSFFTENYSIMGPEVTRAHDGAKVGGFNAELFELLRDFDALIITGQAKSHCVAWTIQDLLHRFKDEDASFIKRIYLLEDTTSAVVVPGIADFADEADLAFERFAKAGANIVNTSTPLEDWPRIDLE
jgi:nicotinamidase-related amidase